MGVKNSSLTRVQPVFDFINQDVGMLNLLFSLFQDKIKLNSKIIDCKYGFTEASIKPPKELLIWCINNISKLNAKEFSKLAGKTSDIDSKRYALYLGDNKIKKEALAELKKERLPQRDWYIFEGYTHPDIYIETEDSIYIGEAKRTEDKLTNSTKWIEERDQLIRHVDSVIDFNKKVYSFFIFDNPALYSLTIYEEDEIYQKSLPHRDSKTIKKIKNSYIGYTTWAKINELFDNKINFPDTING